MLRRVALLVLFLVSTSGVASAQAPQSADPNLSAKLSPGMTVWITDAAGRERRTRIVGVDGGTITATTGHEVERFRTADILRIRARHSDSVINGALIGAGAAVASGLILCSLMESWEICRDDVGPMLRIGALGAGIGIAIDLLIRGRRTIYEAGAPSRSLRVQPVIHPRAAGLRVSVRF